MADVNLDESARAPDPAPDAPANVPAAKERRLRYPLLWLSFIVVLIVGATLISNASPVLQWVGITLVAAPLVVLGLLALGYYLVERGRAAR